MKKQNKVKNIFSNFSKSQINYGILTGVITIVIIMIVLGFVFATSQKAMSTIRDSNVIQDQSASHANETLTWGGNNTAMTLTESRIITSTIIVYNNGTLLTQGDGSPKSNYTISGGAITILNNTPNAASVYGTGTGQIITSTLNVSYNYLYGSSERNITLTGQQGLNVVSSFQPTWSTTIAAFIVISLVLGLGWLIYRKME